RRVSRSRGGDESWDARCHVYNDVLECAPRNQDASRPRKGPSPPENFAGATQSSFRPMCGRGHHRKEIAMSDSTFLLPARPSLEHLRKQAKELLRAYRVGDTVAVEQFRARIPRLADPVPPDEMILADAQFVLAREYGFENWAGLVHHVAAFQLAEDRLEQ